MIHPQIVNQLAYPLIKEMSGTQMSMLQLCKSLLFCRKKENPKPFKLTLSPNQFFDELIRRKQDKDLNIFDLEQSDTSLSYSSPNLLYSQVYENNSLKPKISIKYKQFENKFGRHLSWDQLDAKSDLFNDVNVTSPDVKFDKNKENQNNKFQYECFSNESSLTSEPEQVEVYINNNSIKPPQRKFDTKPRKETRNKRHFSLKHRKLKETLPMTLKQNLSCPDLSKIDQAEEGSSINQKARENIDFIDDFTDKLFKDDLLIDDDFDLVSINFE